MTFSRGGHLSYHCRAIAVRDLVRSENALDCGGGGGGVGRFTNATGDGLNVDWVSSSL